MIKIVKEAGSGHEALYKALHYESAPHF